MPDHEYYLPSIGPMIQHELNRDQEPEILSAAKLISWKDPLDQLLDAELDDLERLHKQTTPTRWSWGIDSGCCVGLGLSHRVDQTTWDAGAQVLAGSPRS